MVKIISWNIRGIGSKGSLERLHTLKNQYNLPLICLQEPLVDKSKIIKFKRKMGMNQALYNCSNKIWLMWTNDIHITILQDKEQHVHVKVDHNSCPSFYLFLVYAKCTKVLRRELWADLRTMASNIHDPWGVIGDFNVISTREEKIGGRPHRIEENMDFIDCVNDCGLQDAGFTGLKVT